MATIKDIAKALNVSVSTVSYALNNGPRSVAPAVRERIIEKAREMRYRPNRVARSMVTRRSHTIGIVPPEFGPDTLLGPYIRLALNGIANESGRLHQDMLLFSRYTNTDSDEMLSILLDGRVDGVIFLAPHHSHRSLEINAAAHLPTVVMNGAPTEGITTLAVDNTAGVTRAMQHLYDLGHRKIGHIAGQLHMADGQERLTAYREFLASRDLPFDPEWVGIGNFVTDKSIDPAVKILEGKNRPTAIFCANDEMAIGALVACRNLGLDVPRDISIVGFDDTSADQFSMTPLTTVRQPIGEMAERATRLLLAMINGEPADSFQLLRPELIVRCSTGPVG